MQIFTLAYSSPLRRLAQLMFVFLNGARGELTARHAVTIRCAFFLVDKRFRLERMQLKRYERFNCELLVKSNGDNNCEWRKLAHPALFWPHLR